MFYDSKNKKLTISYIDGISNTGINLALNNSTIIIQNTKTPPVSYLMGISKLEVLSNDNYIVNIEAPGLPDDFFTSEQKYIVNPCSVDNNDNFYNLLIDNKVIFTFIMFIIFIVFILLVTNYKLVLSFFTFIYNYIKKPKETTIDASKYEGGKQIFYIGGYDYRDYSD